jgi:uncharacterized membrane protein YuzA (DUF378 family)
MKMGGASTAAMALVVLGAVNWGLIGAFDWDLVNTIFGSWPMIVRIVYILVGLSGLWVLYDWFAKKE